MYQSESISTRQERMYRTPTGSLTSKVMMAAMLHSNSAVMCWKRALELEKQGHNPRATSVLQSSSAQFIYRVSVFQPNLEVTLKDQTSQACYHLRQPHCCGHRSVHSKIPTMKYTLWCDSVGRLGLQKRGQGCGNLEEEI